MKSTIRIGFSDQASVKSELEGMFQISDALTTGDVPTCGRGIQKKKTDEVRKFETIKDRQNAMRWVAPVIGSIPPEHLVHLKIRWIDKEMLDRATEFFDLVAPVYAEAYKYSNVFYSASPTGMDVMYESQRPLWLAQLWVAWNMFLNRELGTSLR